MNRVETFHSQVQKLVRAVPFRPFVLVLENGERVLVEHPENIAFYPTPSRSGKLRQDFDVLTDEGRVLSCFGVVTNLFLAGEEGLAG
jgi:hypothetical protein